MKHDIRQDKQNGYGFEALRCASGESHWGFKYPQHRRLSSLENPNGGMFQNRTLKLISLFGMVGLRFKLYPST